MLAVLSGTLIYLRRSWRAMKAAILIFSGLSLSVGCSEGETQSTEMDAADVGVLDWRVDEGTNDGGAVQDDRVDTGSVSNGRTRMWGSTVTSEWRP